MKNALHEAGHVVVAIAVGAEILSTRADDRGGHTDVDILDTMPPECRVAICLAGALAVNPDAQGREYLEYGGKSDVEKCFAYSDAVVERGRRIATDVLDRYRDVVTTIAGQLHRRKYLNGRDVELVVAAHPGAIEALLAERITHAPSQTETR